MDAVSRLISAVLATLEGVDASDTVSWVEGVPLIARVMDTGVVASAEYDAIYNPAGTEN